MKSDKVESLPTDRQDLKPALDEIFAPFRKHTEQISELEIDDLVKKAGREAFAEKNAVTTMRDLFAPVRDQIKESGTSDDELTALLEEVLAPVRQEVADKGITEDEIDTFMYDLRKKVVDEKPTTNKS